MAAVPSGRGAQLHPAGPKYASEADARYIEFREPEGPLTSRRLDPRRIVDVDDAGDVGVEFLFVSKGVSLEGFPRRDEIAAALHAVARAV